MWILKIPWGKMGPGKLGPVSASVNTYILASSRTPKRFDSFPIFAIWRAVIHLDSGLCILPQFSTF